MIQTFRDVGYQSRAATQDGVLRLEFPIEPHRHRGRRDALARAPRRGALDGALLRRRERRDHRREPPPGHDRRDAGAQPGARRVRRTGVRRQPGGRRGGGHAGVQDRAGRSPTRSTSPIVAVPAEAVHDVVLDCAAKGVHGLIVISSGFAETGARGTPAAAAAGRPGPLVRAAAGRPELPRRDQHRPRRLAQRLAVAGDAAARTGRVLLPVRRARGRDPGDGRAPRARPVDVRVRRQPRRRLRQRPAAVLGGGRRDRGRAALPGVDRQPAQVLPDRPPGRPAQARRRGEVRPHHPGRAGRPQRSRTTVAPQAAVDAMFRQAGVIQVETLDEMFDVAQLLAHQPLPMGPRVAVVGNSDALGLLAADAAAAAGLLVEQSVVARRRRDRRGLRARSRRRRSTTPTSTR